MKLPLLISALLLPPRAAWWAAEPVIRDALLKSYIERFNADDREVFAEAFPNAKALAFLAANIPLFECPDKELERTYYFRWWTFRKHLKQTPHGWVITEFLPPVPWAGKHNAINCAAAHHIREGRWLKDQAFVRDYFDWWLHKGGRARAYSFWIADSVLAWCDGTGDFARARACLPDLIKNYEGWEKEKLDAPTDLFWQSDNSDGMEASISRSGFRPTINSYMYGDALTKAAKASSSAPGPVDHLNDGIVSPNAWNWATPNFTFAGHVGTEEWIQYKLAAPTLMANSACCGWAMACPVSTSPRVSGGMRIKVSMRCWPTPSPATTAPRPSRCRPSRSSQRPTGCL